MAEEKLIGLSGNSHQRRQQLKEFRAKYGKENVTRVDNQKPKNKTKCKGTFARIVVTEPEAVQEAKP